MSQTRLQSPCREPSLRLTRGARRGLEPTRPLPSVGSSSPGAGARVPGKNPCLGLPDSRPQLLGPTSSRRGTWLARELPGTECRDGPSGGLRSCSTGSQV